MALDFTIVVNVRNQFGDSDLDIGVFAGRDKTWTFGCPAVSSGQALLLFQSLGVGAEQVLEINDVPVSGGEAFHPPTTSDSPPSMGIRATCMV